MPYTYGYLESYVDKKLKSVDIIRPEQLSVETISARLNVPVHYIDEQSMCVAGHIFLDDRVSPRQQWQDFGHALLDEGDQALATAMQRERQENKANTFALYFCIPTFMIENLQLPRDEREMIWLLMETFGVQPSFAARRLDQYRRNLYGR